MICALVLKLCPNKLGLSISSRNIITVCFLVCNDSLHSTLALIPHPFPTLLIYQPFLCKHFLLNKYIVILITVACHFLKFLSNLPMNQVMTALNKPWLATHLMLGLYRCVYWHCIGYSILLPLSISLVLPQHQGCAQRPTPVT